VSFRFHRLATFGVPLRNSALRLVSQEASAEVRIPLEQPGTTVANGAAKLVTAPFGDIQRSRDLKKDLDPDSQNVVPGANFDHTNLCYGGINLDGANSTGKCGRRDQKAAQLDVESIGSPGHEFVRRRWMKCETAQRTVGNSRILRRITIGLFAQLELLILGGHKDPAILRAIRRCRRQSESLLTGNEAFFLYSVACAQRILDCPMAEVGVFQGSSARIICEAKGERPLHLFDTFSGLPQPGEKEKRLLRHGQYSGSLAAVTNLLAMYSGVHLHPGEFPATAIGMEDTRFGFVHLDVDLYASTLASLEFFYPRMASGGVILTHDYSTLPGVAQAFTDFLATKPNSVIELPTTQAMIVVRS
jgi:O-methyltransferase